jgi:hypothetical protein
MITDRYRRILRARQLETDIGHIERVRAIMRRDRGAESWFHGWDRRMEKVLKEKYFELRELRR